MRSPTGVHFVAHASLLVATVGCAGATDKAEREPDTAVASVAAVRIDSTPVDTALRMESSAPVPPDQHVSPARVRRIADANWREVWRRGGRRQDTVLRAPVFVAADSAMVYVLDRNPMAVVAFHASDGSVVWHSDTLDHPPLGYLRDLAIRPNGEVVFLDDNSMLHRVSPNGTWKAAIHLGDLGRPHSICVPDDTSLLLYTLEEHDPLARIDTLGRVLERYPMPWADLEGQPVIVTQSRLAAAPGGRCAVALTLGRGFATIRGPRVMARQEYIEAAPLPTVAVTPLEINGVQTKSISLPPGHPTAAPSVAVGDSRVVVLYAGRTAARYRILDTYDLETGAYLESWRIPIPATALAMSHKIVFLLGTSAGQPTLAALTR